MVYNVEPTHSQSHDSITWHHSFADMTRTRENAGRSVQEQERDQLHGFSVAANSAYSHTAYRQGSGAFLQLQLLVGCQLTCN